MEQAYFSRRLHRSKDWRFSHPYHRAPKLRDWYRGFLTIKASLCLFLVRSSYFYIGFIMMLTTCPAILHGPTLIRELNDHWEDPSRANFIWLGLLFAVLGITMLAYHQHGEPLEYEGLSDSLFRLYRTRTAQCLLRGDISRCLPYTVETLRLNALAELNRKDDSRRALYITTGVIVRAAINMVC